MKKQIDQIRKKFDSVYTGVLWESEQSKETAFGYFKAGALSHTQTDKKSESKYKCTAIEILEYLNAARADVVPNSPRGYKLTDSIQRVITARLKEDHTVEEFKQVIDYKCHEWGKTDFRKYLRPSTLFSPKHFAEYLCESDGFKKPEQSALNKEISGLMG